jgi:uncharacterized protein
MLFPLSVSYNENYVRLAALVGARHPKLDPNGRQMDTKVVTVRAMPNRTPSTGVTPGVSPSRRGRLDRPLAAIGAAGGVLSGLLGVGGGIVMIPLLVLRAGYRQRDAHAMSLGAIIPISLAGVITYGAAGKVRVGDALALAVGSVVGARVGAGFLTRIKERPLKLVFGAFLGAVAILLVLP